MESVNILNKKYLEPSRPFSQIELKENRNLFFKKNNISDLYVLHSKCNHTYKIKNNGKKYKLLIENENENKDIGNCSICWKLYDTERQYKKIARDLIAEYTEIMNKKVYDHYETELEKLFYNWLYQKN